MGWNRMEDGDCVGVQEEGRARECTDEEVAERTERNGAYDRG